MRRDRGGGDGLIGGLEHCITSILRYFEASEENKKVKGIHRANSHCSSRKKKRIVDMSLGECRKKEVRSDNKTRGKVSIG